MASIAELIIWGENKLQQISTSATLDTEVLLCWILHKERSYLRTWPEKFLSTSQITAFQALLNQRVDGVPIAYLIGKREFWSREFKITPEVLIPRPDTELLIETSLNLLSKIPAPKILDLGTGSGIIAITLAIELPYIQVLAVDKSTAALNIARENANIHKCNNIEFQVSSWLQNIPLQKFALIVSNPPYIAATDPHLQIGDLRFEPQTALTSGIAGLDAITEIVINAAQYLTCNGWLLIEHGCTQKSAVQTLFQQYGYQNIQTYQDLSLLPRVTVGQLI